MDVDVLGLIAEFVKDCTTRKRKMTNNIDEIIFINGTQPFLLRALVYKHTIRKVWCTRFGPKIRFENTHIPVRGFLLSALARTVQI